MGQVSRGAIIGVGHEGCRGGMSEFAKRVIGWQRAHGRHDLPWQQTRDPYRIWLSEIMLQQTQVSTVLGYYTRFVASFPTVASLAAAPLEAVMAHWAGLGYYARARNLHRCACEVITRFGGKFPTEPEILASLPGIGRSTAAAIAAFSVGARAAILDGNVKRVLCRYLAIEGVPGMAAVDKVLWAQAAALLPASDMEAYTQGLMDLGAMVCTRSNPRCGECPVAGSCVAKVAARQDELPYPKASKRLNTRVSTYGLLVWQGQVLLARRPLSGIWGGLLAPPEAAPEVVAAQLGLALGKTQAMAPFIHTFTHFRLRLEPIWGAVCQTPPPLEPTWVWLPLDQLVGAALPTPIRRLLTDLAALY